jgi:hypothetical protein
MKTQRLAIALTVTNLALLVLIGTVGRTTGQTDAPVLRGRALELVDDSGLVRSRLDVEPGGEVVFRLLDQDGTIRVKLGAGRDGSGLLLLDEATEPGIQMIARRTGTPELPATTSIRLKSTDRQERTIGPCRTTKRCVRRP